MNSEPSTDAFRTNVVPLQRQGGKQADPQHREVPQSIPLEQAVLGSLMLNNDGYRFVAAIVGDEDFYDPFHRLMWRTISAQIQRGEKSSPITVSPFLPDEVEGVKTKAYLARLVANGLPASVVDYAKSLAQLTQRRRLISLAEDIRDYAYDMPPEVTAESLFDDLERQIESVRPQVLGAASKFYRLGEVAAAVNQKQMGAKTDDDTLSTGYSRLDAKIQGLVPSEVIILGGRPGMGKTILGLSIGLRVAKIVAQKRILSPLRPDGKPWGHVAFMSMEMSKETLAERALADQADVRFGKIRRKDLDIDEAARLADSAADMEALPMMIDETGALTIEQIKTRARALKKKYGIEVLIVDYLQYIRPSTPRETAFETVGKASRGLKDLAKELQIPVVALAQLSRESAKRDDPRPKMPDLQFSSSIEQDADVIAFIHREEYYHREREPTPGTDAHAKWELRLKEVEGLAEVIIAKNRHGSTGIVEMGYEAPFMRFVDEPPHRDNLPAPSRRPRVSLSVPAGAALKVLKQKMAAAGREVRDTFRPAGVPSNVSVVSYADWVDAVRTNCLPAEQSQDEKALTAYMAKIIPALIGADLIGRTRGADGFVWLTEDGYRIRI